MNIRQATVADLPAIMEIERQPGFEDFVGRSSEDQHREIMAASDAIYLLLLDEADQAVGFALLQGIGLASKLIYLKRLAVRSPGKGAGTRLLKEIILRAFEDYGAHKFWLDAFEHNHRARHVYTVCGLTQEGLLREHYPVANGRANLVVMSILKREWVKD